MGLQQLDLGVDDAITKYLSEVCKLHGEAFESAVAATFELLQVTELVTLMAARAEAANIGAFQLAKACSIGIGSACSHMVGLLPGPLQQLVMPKAMELMALRTKNLKAAAAAPTTQTN